MSRLEGLSDAAFALALVTLRRRRLSADRVASQQDVEIAETRLHTVQAELAGARARLLELENGTRREQVDAVPGITHTRARMEGGQPKLLLALDEERARLVGFDNAGIARFLQGSLEGSTGGSMIESTEDLPVRVRVRGEDRAAVGPVQALALRNGDGTRRSASSRARRCSR